MPIITFFRTSYHVYTLCFYDLQSVEFGCCFVTAENTTQIILRLRVRSSYVDRNRLWESKDLVVMLAIEIRFTS